MSDENGWTVHDRRLILDQKESDGEIVEWERKLRFEVECPEGHESVVKTNFGEETLDAAGGEGSLEVPCVDCGENYALDLGRWPAEEI